jgi:large subunit ribosomal protein L25
MMADSLTLAVQVRTDKGKQAAKRLRSDGRIPCIVYGNAKEPVKLSGDGHEVTSVVSSPAIVTLHLDSGDKKNAVVRDIQRDYLNNTVVHVDFLEVDMDTKVTATINVESTGTPIGLLHDANLEQPLHSIVISCLPADLPERIVVDVTPLDLNDSITVGDLPLPDGVEAVSPDDHTVVLHVALQRTIEEEEGEGGEPKVITKGKKEEKEE